MWIMHQVEKKWRTSREKYMEKKFNIMERPAGLKKPVPTKSKHVMEPSICKRRYRSTKNNVKRESSWKRQNTKFLALATYSNKLIEEDQIQEWLTAGVTFLIPKSENTENPKNYRPVTCLPTMYKLITSVVSRRIKKIYGWWKFDTEITERVLQRIKRMQRSAANFKSSTKRI